MVFLIEDTDGEKFGYYLNTEIKNDENDDDETSYFIPEEDLGESKVEKAFYKFVNDKVINNKLNMYTMSLGEKH